MNITAQKKREHKSLASHGVFTWSGNGFLLIIIRHEKYRWFNIPLAISYVFPAIRTMLFNTLNILYKGSIHIHIVQFLSYLCNIKIKQW